MWRMPGLGWDSQPRGRVFNPRPRYQNFSSTYSRQLRWLFVVCGRIVAGRLRPKPHGLHGLSLRPVSSATGSSGSSHEAVVIFLITRARSRGRRSSTARVSKSPSPRVRTRPGARGRHLRRLPHPNTTRRSPRVSLRQLVKFITRLRVLRAIKAGDVAEEIPV